MIKLNTIMALTIFAISTSGVANAADAKVAPRKSVCYSDFSEKVKKAQTIKIANVCSQVDLENRPEESDKYYKNKDQECDLGLSMPGLPNIGFGLDGFDSCAILKAVTGPMVKAANKEMKLIVQDAVDAVGGDTDIEIDLTDIAVDDINEQHRRGGNP
jgi:hypothetical protein